VSRPRLEVADIFHHHGAAWRRANAGHLSLGQLQVMSAIECCRSAALGGHVERCQDCGHSRIAYNSCRNRHCPKCQGAVARDWLAARAADLLPVGYFHLVFTLPAEIAAIAYQNKAVVYDLLFRAASETLLTIAADPRHLGARIGATARRLESVTAADSGEGRVRLAGWSTYTGLRWLFAQYSADVRFKSINLRTLTVRMAASGERTTSTQSILCERLADRAAAAGASRTAPRAALGVRVDIDRSLSSARIG